MRVRDFPDSLGIIPQEGTFVNIFLQECEKFFLVLSKIPNADASGIFGGTAQI